MYKKIVTPKKITQQWLDRAFAPLRNYLNSHHAQHAEQIMKWTMFMANADNRFYYKHQVTKGYIVFDQAGQLVSCDESALEFEFDWMSEMPAIRPFEERFIHPNVSGWVRDNLRKKDAETYGEEVSIFLQELWGPIVNYDFTNLAVGCPPRNVHFPHSLFIYPKACPGMMVFEFVGDAIADGSCTPQERHEFNLRERLLTFGGWQVFSFIRETLEEDLTFMRDRLAQLLKAAH